MKELREFFKAARWDAGLSQVELAEKANVKQCTISRYETGKQDISLPTAMKLAKAIGDKNLSKAITDHINRQFE